jgi:hypothetical protein
VAATAIAREPAGFVWAIAHAVKPAAQEPKPEIIRTSNGRVYRLNPATTFKK